MNNSRQPNIEVVLLGSERPTVNRDGTVSVVSTDRIASDPVPSLSELAAKVRQDVGCDLIHAAPKQATVIPEASTPKSRGYSSRTPRIKRTEEEVPTDDELEMLFQEARKPRQVATKLAVDDGEDLDPKAAAEIDAEMAYLHARDTKLPPLNECEGEPV